MRCPKCAAEISVLRDYCPHCGTPTEDALRERERNLERVREPKEIKSNRKTVLIAGGALLLLLAAAGKIQPFGGGFHFPGPVRIDTRRVTNEAVTIGAPELFEAYHTDSEAADRRFGGRQIIVTGQFVRTVPDGYGSIDMRLKTNHPDLPLGIDIDGHSVDAATKLEPGETVTVSCQRVAGTGDDPWLQDCVIQPPAESDVTSGASPNPAVGAHRAQPSRSESEPSAGPSPVAPPPPTPPPPTGD